MLVRKKTLEEAKKFLDEFALPLDYEKVKKGIDHLGKLVCEDYKIKGKHLECRFVDDEKFGKTASVSDTIISINKLRLNALFELQFDDTDEGLREKVERFMKGFNKKKEHTLYEKMLHKFVLEMSEIGERDIVLQAGSFKTIKYEFIDIAFHENRHILQKEYIPLLKSPFEAKKTEELVLFFTMLYNEVYHELIKAKKIEWGYQDNRKFPIEFDARYVSLINLNALRKLYFPDDELFSLFIARTILLPEDFDSTKAANELFGEMERYFALGDFKKYEKTYEMVENDKEKIVSEFIRRFEEMKSIYKENMKK